MVNAETHMKTWVCVLRAMETGGEGNEIGLHTEKFTLILEDGEQTGGQKLELH